ncbi:hypothetical protein E4U30_000655 [Claviceps sp. LM220 group G6]|nr:hypothetical protein E4U15_008011 [Claviceps sp. LM218 group G6]KAG6097413.1 hypothetical protein E4U30_000655 [Claviceps sp. LM220 group G6]KAG6109783.1 hypothetical protein E4U14_003101 [Claviceps sp. LM454 group G7]
MPPRRTHKKSRTGCQRCKTRKVKCDEVRPRCGNCSKHGVLCDFESLSVLQELAPSATSGSPSPAASTPALSPNVHRTSPSMTSPLQISAPSPVSPPWRSRTPKLETPRPAVPCSVDRLLELRLLHQYTTSTCKTLLTNSPATDDIWQRAVPEMAFQDKPYLADAMLCVAALHLRSQHPSDKSLVQASHAYSASTLAAYVTTLAKGITPDNAEALFLTATLIAFQATASRIFVKDYADDADDVQTGRVEEGTKRYTLPMAWFHAFQGVKTVVSTSWQWIRNSSIVQAVVDSQPSFQLDLNPLNPNSFFGHLLENLEDELAKEPIDKVTATHQGYFHAVSVLNWAHKNPDAPAVLAFPASVSRRFVEVLEEKRPRALAILACFFALFQRMDPVWWLQGVSRREVMGLVSLFEIGSPWWRHLEWPVRIALWEGDAIPPAIWGVDYKQEADASKTSSESMMSHIELFSKLTSIPTPVPRPDSASGPAQGSATAASSAVLQAELDGMTAPLD